MIAEQVAAKAAELSKPVSSLEVILGELSDNSDEQALIKHILVGTEAKHRQNILENGLRLHIYQITRSGCACA